MTWTEPELFLEHPNGVKVWRAYKDNNRMTYWFTTAECDDDVESGSEFIFDVRDLPEPPKAMVGDDWDARHTATIVHAINEGLLPLPEENQPRDPCDAERFDRLLADVQALADAYYREARRNRHDITQTAAGRALLDIVEKHTPTLCDGHHMDH
jgi:hypothetical protein